MSKVRGETTKLQVCELGYIEDIRRNRKLIAKYGSSEDN